MTRKILDRFEELGIEYCVKIGALSSNKVLTPFEERAFTALCTAASKALPSCLDYGKLPFKSISEIDDYTLSIAYLFSCATEFHSLLSRIKNLKEISDALDVSTEKLTNDFAGLLGGTDIQELFHETLKDFDDVVAERNEHRDLWFSQIIVFGQIVSKGSIDLDKNIDNDPTLRIQVGLVSQMLRTATARAFDQIVFGKPMIKDIP